MCIRSESSRFDIKTSGLFTKFCSMDEAHGWSEGKLSEVFHFTIDFIYRRWQHTLRWNPKIRELLPTFSAAISSQGCPLDKAFGFLDGTRRKVARPSRFQKQFYSGHKRYDIYSKIINRRRYHALGYQSMVLPNGLVLLSGNKSHKSNHKWTM